MNRRHPTSGEVLGEEERQEDRQGRDLVNVEEDVVPMNVLWDEKDRNSYRADVMDRAPALIRKVSNDFLSEQPLIPFPKDL